MRKIVVNACYGGFGLSDFAKNLLGYSTEDYVGSQLARDDVRLVDIVERFPDKVNGFASELRIVEIPDDVQWAIQEYDGMEHVVEVHRKWYP